MRFGLGSGLLLGLLVGLFEEVLNYYGLDAEEEEYLTYEIDVPEVKKDETDLSFEEFVDEYKQGKFKDATRTPIMLQTPLVSNHSRE